MNRSPLPRRPLPSMRPLATLTATALLSACAAGPNFVPPDAPAAQRYTAQPLPAQTASAPVVAGEAQTFLDGQPLPARWWQLYGSPKLDALVMQALAASPSVASAQAALRQASENLRAQRSGFFPTVDGSASATRQKIDGSSFGGSSFSSTTSGNGGSGGSTTSSNFSGGSGGSIYNLFSASVDVSYTLDLFGGVRRGVESQAALVDYQYFQLEGTYQTLIANVVTSAVSEARLRRLIVGQRRIVEDYERQLKITNARFSAGAVGRADVLTVQSSLATERATLVSLELQLAQAQNQLAVYLGQLPSERVATDFELEELRLPQEIPLSLPSELVRQRPDVRAAEAQLHSASAQVGVATANLFPQLTISGSYGTQASKTGDLFKGDVWSLAANLTQPIFHGGELTAKRRAAIAAYDQAAADYRQTVLTAFQNVADALYQVDADARTLAAQADAIAAADKSLKLTELQYKLGAVAYISLLTAEQQFIVANTNYVNAQAARHSDTAALLQALGGGWWNRGDDAAMPQTVASKQPLFPN